MFRYVMMLNTILPRMLAVVGIVLVSADCWSAEPTLARLSFWLPDGQEATFESTYEAKVEPILKQHGFVPHGESERPVPEGIFSRSYAFESVQDFLDRRRGLWQNPAWKQMMVDFGLKDRGHRSGAAVRPDRTK